MVDPLASVIIPTHNRADLLCRAIESVQAQTVDELEILVVDDGSRDRTPTVVRRYAVTDERIRYHRFEESQGACAARNRGIEEATGRYIALLDDDDAYLPNKIELLARRLEEAGSAVGLAYSNVRVHRRNGQHLTIPGSGGSGDVLDRVRRGMWFQTGSTLIRKEACARFDESLPCLQDVDFHLKMVRNYGAVFVDEVTAVQYVDHDYRRITHQDPDDLEYAVGVLERRHYGGSDSREMRRARAYLMSFAGKNLMANDRVRARSYFRRALRNRSTPKTLGLYLLSWTSDRWADRFRRLWFRVKMLALRLSAVVRSE